MQLMRHNNSCTNIHICMNICTYKHIWSLCKVDLLAQHVDSKEPAEVSYETVRHICFKLVYENFLYRLRICIYIKLYVLIATHSHLVCLALRACLLHKFFGCPMGWCSVFIQTRIKSSLLQPRSTLLAN